ncbi:MAG: PIG-L family deacetylase [Acidimicrobiia bacterium]|nr:PIG-L family deacetylase [Acidimicrobiia bacterium]
MPAGSPTLLAIHAHPDDESSKGAATVAAAAARGIRCVLITATGGEAGDILNPAMHRDEVRDNLAEYRAKELAEAAAIIGYSEVIELGYRDSGMPDTPDNANPEALANATFDEVLGRVVAEVRRVRPAVMLGYDSHERYPHPDHLYVHRLGLAAFDAAADAERFPDAGEPWAVDRLLAPVFTVRRVRALHDAAVADDLVSPFADWIDTADAAYDHGKHLIAVPVAHTMAIAREALRAHRTQVDPDGFWFSLPLDLAVAAYPYEDFEVLVARVPLPDGADDLFG